jgi:hypothetical protein
MAMTKRNVNSRAFKPTWPDPSSLSANQMWFTYDRPTDTLFVDFYGDARPAASVQLDRGDRDYLFLRVDPETEAVVGLQIEHFLSYAVTQLPELARALDVASLVDEGRDNDDRITRCRSRGTSIENAVTVIEDLRRLSA